MREFEKLLQENLAPLQRYVNFKVGSNYDAEDIIQEVCLTATEKFETLKCHASFKAWIIGIAKHKCNDYYRKKAKVPEIPLEYIPEKAFSSGRFGITKHNVVRDTLDELEDKDREILYLYFFKNISQEDIAKQLSIPIGTVKSRLHYAKEKFKKHYPNRPEPKGDEVMKQIPKLLPQYNIEKSALAPFSVKWEELQGWFIVPHIGEKLTWGLYEMPSRKLTEYTEMKATGKAEIHGIEGIEISATQCRTNPTDKTELTFVAQLTDTHCRYLAESHIENGVRKLCTFLDSDEFVSDWGFGEDNCGNETNLTAKGILQRNGNEINGFAGAEVLDIVGRYMVTIGSKTYDTVCVMDIMSDEDGIATEQYIDKNGRTILWRRFNKNDWAFNHYGKMWIELLPNNERLVIDGETYVHWYDCVTDYVF